MIVIPYQQLDPQTLTALIEEFVTRDGAVHGHQDTGINVMVATVRKQLQTGKVEIHYDEESESWTIVRKDRA